MPKIYKVANKNNKYSRYHKIKYAIILFFENKNIKNFVLLFLYLSSYMNDIITFNKKIYLLLSNFMFFILR